MSVWVLTFLPVMAALAGATIAVLRPPTPSILSAVQHFAAGVVFAAAAGEILPDVKHGAVWAVAIGGTLGTVTMLLLSRAEASAKGLLGLTAVVGVDILIDGLVLGLGFAAGEKAGILLTIALTLEVLFLALTVASELRSAIASRVGAIAWTGAIVVLLPIGALLAVPASALPASVVAGLFSFGLIALLYLVTEELLVEAHKSPDQLWTTAMFFVGFLLLLLLDQAIGGS